MLREPSQTRILIHEDDEVIKAFNLSHKEVHRSAPLFKCEHSIVLAVKFRSECIVGDGKLLPGAHRLGLFTNLL